MDSSGPKYETQLVLKFVQGSYDSCKNIEIPFVLMCQVRLYYKRNQSSMEYAVISPMVKDVATFLFPDWGDLVDTGIGLSYRPATR